MVGIPFTNIRKRNYSRRTISTCGSVTRGVLPGHLQHSVPVTSPRFESEVKRLWNQWGCAENQARLPWTRGDVGMTSLWACLPFSSSASPSPHTLLKCWPWVPPALSKKDLGCWFDVDTLKGVCILIRSWKGRKVLREREEFAGSGRTREALLHVLQVTSFQQSAQFLRGFAQCGPSSGTGPQDTLICQP